MMLITSSQQAAGLRTKADAEETDSRKWDKGDSGAVVQGLKPNKEQRGSRFSSQLFQTPAQVHRKCTSSKTQSELEFRAT